MIGFKALFFDGDGLLSQYSGSLSVVIWNSQSRRCEFGTRWKGLEIEAECLMSGASIWPDAGPWNHSAGVPEERCNCGIHVVPLPRQTIQYLTEYSNGIMAVVETWGKTVVHERGWRASNAKVIGIVDVADIEPWLPMAFTRMEVKQNPYPSEPGAMQMIIERVPVEDSPEPISVFALAAEQASYALGLPILSLKEANQMVCDSLPPEAFGESWTLGPTHRTIEDRKDAT